MATIIAAIDGSATSSAVLQAARTMAASRHANVEALNVLGGDAEGAAVAASGLGVQLRIAEGDPTKAIVDAVDRDEVVMAVLGGGARRGGRPLAGHVTQGVIQKVTKPVVVVPPELALPGTGAPLKVLVSLDGTDATSRAVDDAIRFVGDAEFVGLHVFPRGASPPYWDHYYYDYPLWCREFLDCFCNGAAVRVEARQGDAVAQILDVAIAEEAGLIALAWCRDLSPGRAAVVTGVLSLTRIPVLVFPAADGVVAQRRRVVGVPHRQRVLATTRHFRGRSHRVAHRQHTRDLPHTSRRG